jgi:(d)CTP diphosphatase
MEYSSKDKNIVPVVCAIFVRQRLGQVEALLFRRGPHRPHAGYWEFPGGKLESGETEVQALEREIKEELGISVSIGQRLGAYEWQLGERFIRLTGYFVEAKDDGFDLKAHDALQWFSETEVVNAQILPGDIALLKMVFRLK